MTFRRYAYLYEEAIKWYNTSISMREQKRFEDAQATLELSLKFYNEYRDKGGKRTIIYT